MVRRGRRFESVRGLCTSAVRRRFLVQADLLLTQRTVGMEPFMELSRRRPLSGGGNREGILMGSLKPNPDRTLLAPLHIGDRLRWNHIS